MSEPEIIVVANRLPVSMAPGQENSLVLDGAPGGLVSALSPVAERLGCTWVGWLDSGIAREQHINSVRFVSVAIDHALFANYYDGFANQVLWPVFHGLSEFAAEANSGPGFEQWWPAYQQVNLKFAERVAEIAGHGAFVWVQDYHLLLVPGFLRKLRPDLRIAVFLHIPFPARALLASEPWARQLLQGMSVAALIGVQREVDGRHLKGALQKFTQEESPNIRAFPISIDATQFVADAYAARDGQAALKFRERFGAPGGRLLLSVDRLDYTKGVTERVAAFGEVLATWNKDEPLPVLVQVLTPTRQTVPAYREYSFRVHEEISKVRSRFATSQYEPIVTISTPVSSGELVAAYLAADVMCVTSLRDGMNLVAKEFVVSRVDEQGVLVLSREAGAVDELVEALAVDPASHNDLAATLRRALAMAPSEAALRMRRMRSRVIEYDVHRWAVTFLSAAGVHLDGHTHSERRDNLLSTLSTSVNGLPVKMMPEYRSSFTLPSGP